MSTRIKKSSKNKTVKFASRKSRKSRPMKAGGPSPEKTLTNREINEIIKKVNKKYEPYGRSISKKDDVKRVKEYLKNMKMSDEFYYELNPLKGRPEDDREDTLDKRGYEAAEHYLAKGSF